MKNEEVVEGLRKGISKCTVSNTLVFLIFTNMLCMVSRVVSVRLYKPLFERRDVYLQAELIQALAKL